MIQLKRAKEPRTLDLGFGVAVTVKPLTYALWRAAGLAAERQALQIAADKGLVDAAGGTMLDIPDPHDRDGIRGLRDQFMLQSLGRHAITAWSGVADETGAAAAVTPAAIDQLILQHPLIAARFEIEYLRELDAMLVEGNASGAAPNGTTAAAPTTADAATTPTSPAPAAGAAATVDSAPTASTH
jgi:hypothetical protein